MIAREVEDRETLHLEIQLVSFIFIFCFNMFLPGWALNATRAGTMSIGSTTAYSAVAGT